MGCFNILLCLSYFFVEIICWDLSRFGIDNSYYISGIAVYRNRAFLALPRDVCFNNISNPTAIEVSWFDDVPINIFGIRKNIFPSSSQIWGENCKNLQNAISLEIEPKRPTLWLLDKGNEYCPAKVLSYSLYHNAIAQSCDLNGIPQKNLRTFTIDPVLNEFGLKAYIGDAGENTLIVFSLKQLKWWRLNLIDRNNPMQGISSYYMAVSKTGSDLFITGKNSLEMYSLDLDDIRSTEGPLPVIAQDVFEETNITLLGNKLGISSALEADYKGGLSYFLLNDYAIVRWEIGTPIQAEYHNVLAQSYEVMPFVSQLFSGPQNGVWGLVNPLNADQCYSHNNTEVLEAPILSSRVVKILKYNTFLSTSVSLI